jgi:predicted ester cyclase
MGIPPTEREVSVRVVEIFRLAGGQIAERWGVVDRTALMKQLGMVPEGAPVDPIAARR